MAGRGVNEEGGTIPHYYCYHAPRRGSAFASPSNGSAATSPASIIVRAYESWADDENQCLVVTSTFASRKGGNENSPFGASTKSVVVPARGTDPVRRVVS